MLGVNARVEDLKKKLVDDINAAKIPVCLLDYVITEILSDVRRQRAGEVRRERKAYEDELKKEAEREPAPGEIPEGEAESDSREGGS